MSKQKTVLVTGIGGNVGQGIIRNIRASGYDIRVVGTNVLDFSPGNHLCDVFYKVPYAYDAAYISTIESIVKKEGVEIILPATDYEMFYLATHKNQISAKVVASDANTAGIYLDKYKTFLYHQKHDIPFAQAFLPSEYPGSFKDYIVKPKEGRGSRGLHINPKDLNPFSDKEYMVQELHKGVEITTAFYVTQSNEIHGWITFERELVNGTTHNCRVVSKYEDRVLPILHKIVENSAIRGSANLQSIVTSEGVIQPFEVNCRISGTNSIRSQFGFEDVKYTLQEYLYEVSPDSPKITKGIATRILMDVIYKNEDDFDSIMDNNNDHYIF